jgi:glycosyltransferase involved in cell wall biosynthesis
VRILHVISSTNPAGGGPIEGIRQLQAPLADLGVCIEVASCDPPDAAWLESSGLPTHALGPGILRYRYTPRIVPWLRANAARFDAVIVNGIWQYHSFAVWRALHGTNTPYFVFTHGMLGPWFKRRYPLKHLKKWMYWPWGDYRVLRDARAVLFTCDEERILARESFGLYRANEMIAGFGASSPPAESSEVFIAANPQLVGKSVVLFIGRLREVKGCDLLLDAFAKVAETDDDLHLVIAGPDASGWQTELQARASRLGLAQRVTWPGMLEGAMKWGAFQAAAVLCLPSHHENFGVVVAEALGCGRPVLISNKVNIWREIDADRSGFVDEDTVDGTVRNLRRWLALDSDEYGQMCGRALRCFETRFQIQRAAERLAEIVRNGLTCT